MARRPRPRTIRAKDRSALTATRNAVTLLGASLDLSGRATRSVTYGRHAGKGTVVRTDWQAIGGDFDRAVGRAAGRIKG